MFTALDINFVLVPLMFVLAVVSRLVRRRSKREPDPIKRTYWVLKMDFGILTVFLAFMLLSLPGTPALSTFGHPDGVEDISSPDRLLHYMQWYNRTLVRTTQVMFWFILIFPGWFMLHLRQFAEIISAGKLDVRSAQSKALS